MNKQIHSPNGWHDMPPTH